MPLPASQDWIGMGQIFDDSSHFLLSRKFNHFVLTKIGWDGMVEIWEAMETYSFPLFLIPPPYLENKE